MQSLIKLVVHDSFWHGMKCVLLPVLPLALWHTGLKPYMRYDSFEENIAVARARGSCNFNGKLDDVFGHRECKEPDSPPESPSSASHVVGRVDSPAANA